MRLPALACACFVAAALSAQQQSTQRAPGWPCSGGRAVDPSYSLVAERSGGHLYMLDPSEIEQTCSLIGWHHNHTETVFRSMGELRERSREFTFPVDSMIESLVITVSLQCKESIAILDPSGIEAGGERVDFRAGRAIRIVRPVPGLWKIRLAGRGLFAVTVEGISELGLDSVRFVEPGGRPGHEGLFRMEKPPALGSAAMLQLDLSKGPEKIRLLLVGSDGRTLETLESEPLPDGSHLARLTVRHPVFRVAVEGVDERGLPFQRMEAPMLSADEPVPAVQ